MGRNPVDLTKRKFGKLTPIEIVEHCGKFRPVKWRCICDCNREKIVTSRSLLDGTSTHCGCETRNRLVGQRFGRLVVVSPTDISLGYSKEIVWECTCDCGNTAHVPTGRLQHGTTKSCGCITAERNIYADITCTSEGLRIYGIWSNMKDRCYNQKSSAYKDYGLRGIRICDEWLGNDGLKNFYEWSIQNGYSNNLSIDRINVNGNYEPFNCRWTTQKVQANNTRTNVYVEYKGELLTLHQVWDKYSQNGVSYKHFHARYKKYGWDLEDALTRPLNGTYITVDGVTKSVSEWSKIYGIKSGTIHYRLNNGWSNEDAIKKPVRKTGKRTE